MTASFLWYDLETWGIDARYDRIAQFAAQRTDDQLNPLGPPDVVWFAPARDLLPQPFAALVTGLDPFDLERRGECESDAIGQVQALMAQAGTCSVGWNTLRFDDEFIRHTLFRNFLDPYVREWAEGNSRWDLLDFARLAYALRPEGVIWPQHESGKVSFRLEHLAEANGVTHSAAHDARSDVEATLGMAQRLRAAQPKLWDYALGFRGKSWGQRWLVGSREPVLHVSGRFPVERRCAALVLPLGPHPRATNQILVVDLRDDPSEWLGLSAEQLAERLFTRASDGPRIPVKAVHLNRAPALVPMQHLRDEDFERLQIDPGTCRVHAARLLQAVDLGERMRDAYRTEWPPPHDVDAALYDALPDRRDQGLHRQIRASVPQELAQLSGRFQDPRGNELLWRYRARNWPESLNAEEQADWHADVAARLQDPDYPRSLQAFRASLDEARAAAATPDQIRLLDTLEEWSRAVMATVAPPTA
ncbi:MAG: exodeoxyribonuclease I [Xanthomonadales bacterium]|nr:exodeoxyribonuclease I [Xanthomonadales bacterium]